MKHTAEGVRNENPRKRDFDSFAARAWDLGHAGIKYVEYVGHSVKDAQLALEEAASSLVGGVNEVLGPAFFKSMHARAKARQFEKLQNAPEKVRRQRGKAVAKAQQLREEKRFNRELIAVTREDILERLKRINTLVDENLIVKELRESFDKAEELLGGPLPNVRRMEDVISLPDPDKAFQYIDPSTEESETGAKVDGEATPEDTEEPLIIRPDARATLAELVESAQMLNTRLATLIDSTAKDITSDLEGVPHTKVDAKGRKRTVMEDQQEVPAEKTEALGKLKEIRKEVRELITVVQDFYGNTEAVENDIVRAEKALTKQKDSRNLPENVALDYEDAINDVERTRVSLHVIQLRRLHTQRLMRETRQAVVDLKEGRNYKQKQRGLERQGQEDAVLKLEYYADRAKRYVGPKTLRRNLPAGSSVESIGGRPTLHDIEKALAGITLPKPVRSAVNMIIRNRYNPGGGNIHYRDLRDIRYYPVEPAFIETLLDVVRPQEKKQVQIPERREQTA